MTYPVGTTPDRLEVMHAQVVPEVEDIMQLVNTTWPGCELGSGPVSWVVGLHAGPGLLGLVASFA